MEEEVEVIMIIHLNLDLHSVTQMMSLGSFLVEGTLFHLTSSKILLRTSSGADGVQGEAEAELVDHFYLLLVDSLLLEMLFLHLTQVLLHLVLWDMEALLRSPLRHLVEVGWETSNQYQPQLK